MEMKLSPVPALLLLAIIPLFNSSVNGAVFPNLEPSTDDLLGKPAPGFSLTSIANEQVSLNDLLGRVLVLDFWATWCPPCRMVIPLLSALYGKFGPSGLEIISVDLQESAGDVKAFAQQNNMDWIVVIDTDGKVANRYNIMYIPTLFIVDREGVVKFMPVGLTEEAVLASEVKQLLGQTTYYPERDIHVLPESGHCDCRIDDNGHNDDQGGRGNRDRQPHDLDRIDSASGNRHDCHGCDHTLGAMSGESRARPLVDDTAGVDHSTLAGCSNRRVGTVGPSSKTTATVTSIDHRWIGVEKGSPTDRKETGHPAWTPRSRSASR